MKLIDYIICCLIMFVIQDLCLKLEIKHNKELFYNLYIKNTKNEKYIRGEK